MLDDRKFQIVGLFGFIASGCTFLTIGIQSQDCLTILGSALWIASCIVWLIPLVWRR